MSTQLQKILADKGLRHADVAKALGVSRQAVQQWATKGSPTVKNLARLAEFLGVTPGQVTGAEPYDQAPYSRTDAREASRSDWTLVPILDATGSCGPGSPSSSGQTIGAVEFSDDFLRSLPGVFGIREDQFELVFCSGDSMSPTIVPGGLVLVDTHQTEIQGDGIYVFINGEDVFIKRLQINLDRTLTLISDNPKYHPQTLSRDELDGAHVHGRVVFVLNGTKV